MPRAAEQKSVESNEANVEETAPQRDEQPHTPGQRKCSVCGEYGHKNTRHDPRRGEPRARKPKLLPGTAKLSGAQEKQIKIGLTFAIIAADAGAGLLLPAVWQKEDRFAPNETSMLVEAIYAEMETFPNALYWLASIAGTGVHVQLAYVIGAIVAPRLARRGIIPAELAALIAFGPVLMAAGATPDGVWPNGTGQVPADVPTANGATVQAGIPLEGRPGEVAGSAEDQILAGLGGHSV